MARPRLRRTRAEWPFLAVLAVLAAAAAYLMASPTHWLRGASIIAAACLLAGVLRLVLPPQRAGMLVVRRRWLDVACYVVLGVLIVTVGLVLPG